MGFGVQAWRLTAASRVYPHIAFLPAFRAVAVGLPRCFALNSFIRAVSLTVRGAYPAAAGMEEVIKPYPVIKTGLLKKLGGGGGGHKNWKDRYFVLSNHLAYYPSEKDYEREPEKPLGTVLLNAYFAAPVEDSAANFEFVVQAYPKSLVCRAQSASEMNEWIEVLRAPVTGCVDGK